MFPKCNWIFGLLCNKNCRKELSKIVQSGHTAGIQGQQISAAKHGLTFSAFLQLLFRDQYCKTLCLCLNQRTHIHRGHITVPRWHPVYFVLIKLFGLCWISESFTSLVESKPVKQEVSRTVILPPMVSIVFLNRELLWLRQKFWLELQLIDLYLSF